MLPFENVKTNRYSSFTLKKNTKNTITNIVKMSQFKNLQNWNRNVDDV